MGPARRREVDRDGADLVLRGSGGESVGSMGWVVNDGEDFFRSDLY